MCSVVLHCLITVVVVNPCGESISTPVRNWFYESAFDGCGCQVDSSRPYCHEFLSL